MEGINMCCEKNCYFCRNLCYFDLKSDGEFYCTFSGMSYRDTNLKLECENFIQDLEE
jgi:hypothetical protein